MFTFLLNAIIFLTIFNIGRVVSWFQTKRWLGGNPAYTIILPLSLALLLTVIDGFRLAFVYKLGIFFLGAFGLYWLASQISRLNRW